MVRGHSVGHPQLNTVPENTFALRELVQHFSRVLQIIFIVKLSFPLVTAALLTFHGLFLSPPGSAQEDPPVDSETPRGGVADPFVEGALPALSQETSRRAAAAAAKQDWETALKLYREIVEFAPENALARANLGAVYFQAGDYKAAGPELEKAVELNPALNHTRVTLGMTYFMLEQPYLAISVLSRAVNDDPADARAHNYLAVALRQKGWVDGAEEELLKAVNLDPKNAEAHFNLALVYLERKVPAPELARRHYYIARDLGAEPDKIIEKQLNEGK